MVQPLRFEIAAPPERVASALVRATARESAVGFALTDRTAAALVGTVSSDGSFKLRRARGLTTAPRVAFLKGSIGANGTGARVVATYGIHAALRLAGLAWVLVVLGFAVVILPSVGQHPELLWIPLVLGGVVGLMLLPFFWLAVRDRIELRASLRTALEAAGAVLEAG